MSAPKVFISYTHDSDEHRERVLALSERLRADGIETTIDQYLNGAPLQGWPRWMLDQIDAADSVLVVCTETYYRRFRGHEEPGKGKGGDWEGALITQEIYDGRSRTLKFIPVFFSAVVNEWIPEPLRSVNYYAVTSESGYQALYDFLLEQSGVEAGPIGALKAKPRRKGKALTFSEENSASRLPSTKKKRQPNPKKTAKPPRGNSADSYRRALRLLADNDYDGALEALNQTIGSDPALALAYYNRGLTHYFKRDDELAVNDFNRALDLGFDDALLFRNRANAHSRIGDVERALADYAEAIALEPDNPLAYLNRGEVYENTLQKEAAATDYQTILRLVCDPQFQEEARNRLIAMGMRIPEPSAALLVWQKKLAFLQVEEAKAVDAEQKFSIQQRIEEAQAKIRELKG